ncbi:radical SAM family heme chaperone HemW [Flavobacteriaceae bacterium]|nr:radical SAM family heme chaperone HemW [Flavobacteriaceae bacterium]MDA9572306.1 radical SAM family heme chaperone HemW [Flavobacteriaceae bacterium]
MSNLYFHYPFCKQACHYCNFHFSTTSKTENALWMAMKKEMTLRLKELDLPIESIYFGGGSPSLLDPLTISDLLGTIKSVYELKSTVEVTLEVNPDDVTETYLVDLKKAGINRLSLGVQSFLDHDLRLMNRAHQSSQALDALKLISKIFTNFSVDLIYGMPYSSLTDWEQNLDTALSYNPPHISSYALTVEEKTVLYHQVKKNEVILLPEEAVEEQYHFMVQKLEQLGYVNYEFSNFGKPNFFSVNNQNYWKGKPYLGIGPSAHSFDGKHIRRWNVSNNQLYLKSIKEGQLPFEEEQLTQKDRYNEYLMTGLRTINGVSLLHVQETFGKRYALYLEEQAARHLSEQNFFWDGDHLKISASAKFLTDGLAADLFIV